MHRSCLGAMPVLNVLDQLVAFCGITDWEDQLTAFCGKSQGDLPANGASVVLVGMAEGWVGGIIRHGELCGVGDWAWSIACKFGTCMCSISINGFFDLSSPLLPIPPLPSPLTHVEPVSNTMRCWPVICRCC